MGTKENMGGEWAREHSGSGWDGVEGSCPGTGTLRGWGRQRVPPTSPPSRRTGPCRFLQLYQAAAPNPIVLLLQLVPKFCEYCYEQVLQEGASSLDSHTISLQLSDSFDLMELIEQYNMQLG